MRDKEKVMDIIDSFITFEKVKKDCKKYTLEALMDKMDFKRCGFVFNGTLPAMMLHEYEMYYLLKTFREWMDLKDPDIEFDIKLLNVKRYFTNEEINKLEYHVIEKDKEENEFVFENVDYTIKGKQYICARISAQELQKMVDGGFLCYDFDMQREPEIVRRHGVEFKRAKIYRNSVNGIQTSMKKNKYKPTAISINVLQKPNGEENSYYYDENNRTFTIYKDSYNVIIDGMHRLVATLKCLETNPTLSQVMQVNIMIYNVTEAREYIHQEALKNAISKDLIKAYENDTYTAIANALNVDLTSTENMLNGKIATTKEEVKINKLITVANMVNMIEDSFVVKDTPADRRRLIQYLISFFNEVYSYFYDDYTDIAKSRLGDSLVCYPNAMYVFFQIAKNLHTTKNFEEKMPTILDKIDFSKNGDFSMVKYITSFEKELIKTDKQKIATFINKVMEV